MIIEALMNVVKWLIETLMVFTVPSLGEDFQTALDTFIKLFEFGTGLFSFVFPISITGFVSIWVGIQVFKKVYPLVMWILRKIPMLNIK